MSICLLYNQLRFGPDAFSCFISFTKCFMKALVWVTLFKYIGMIELPHSLSLPDDYIDFSKAARNQDPGMKTEHRTNDQTNEKKKK
jgi:hypothetical protein